MNLLLATESSKFNPIHANSLMSRDSAKLSVSIIFIADFVNQFLRALYLSFRFIRQRFPGGEEIVIYQDDREAMTIVVEDTEVELP